MLLAVQLVKDNYNKKAEKIQIIKKIQKIHKKLLTKLKNYGSI